MKTIKKHLFFITIVIVLIIVIIILILKLKLDKNSCVSIYEEPSIIREESPNNLEEQKCTVDLKGAVKTPGVYTIDCNKYVNDIISLAGGLTEEADTSNINLAKQVTNEMVIIVYTKNEISNINSKDEICQNQLVDNTNIINNNLININTASVDELKTIPGIGDTRAKAIIEYRNNYGSFKTIDEIKNVKGIGESLYEQIKIYLTT